MTGMHRATGKPLAGAAHIAQSIADILSTPIGSRCMRRDYGSRLPELIDAPINPATRQLLAAASAGAIARWEPRIALTRIRLDSGNAGGGLAITIEGSRTDTPVPTALSLNIPL